jgi:hypothetical protein
MLEFDTRNKKTRYRHLPQVKRVVCDEVNLDDSRPLCLNILATLTDLRLLLDFVNFKHAGSTRQGGGCVPEP